MVIGRLSHGVNDAIEEFAFHRGRLVKSEIILGADTLQCASWLSHVCAPTPPCPQAFLTTLCGLRLPMRPLSVPAFSSMTALMRVGVPEASAAFTARDNSSGEVA